MQAPDFYRFGETIAQIESPKRCYRLEEGEWIAFDASQLNGAQRLTADEAVGLMIKIWRSTHSTDDKFDEVAARGRLYRVPIDRR